MFLGGIHCNQRQRTQVDETHKTGNKGVSIETDLTNQNIHLKALKMMRRHSSISKNKQIKAKEKTKEHQN